LIADRLLSPL